jgi:amidohydrolase
MNDQLSQKIQALAQALAPQMVEMRRQLHRFPELSEQEEMTTARIRGWLREAGIAELPLPLKTGLVGVIAGSAAGKDPATGKVPVIAIRADIDALPIEEETGLAFASEVKGVMHACGHDFHAAAVVGAGMILARLREEFPGEARLFFQPAEENLAGANILIRAGAMDQVDAVIAGHTNPEIPVGQIGLKSGALMASSDVFAITLEGKGGHAAMPQNTVDPIVAGAAVVSALQTVVSRNVSPIDSAVLSVSVFHAGSAPNVIPATARLEGTVRAFDPVIRQQTLQRLEQITQGVASALGVTAQVEHIGGIPPVINDDALSRLLAAAAAEILGPEGVMEPRILTGSEDFSQYGGCAPICYAWLGCGRPGRDQYLWHHPRYDTAEEVLPTAAAFFARSAVDYLRSRAASE